MDYRAVRVTDEMLLNVKCPMCGVKKGEVCVYAPNPVTSAHSRSPAVIAIIERVGTPTKRPHGARYQLVRKQIRLFERRRNAPKITPPRPVVRETLAIFREYDQIERGQLRAWVRSWGWILLSPPVSVVSDGSNDPDGQLDQED